MKVCLLASVDATERRNRGRLARFGRFHLGTETEAAKYRRRVPSASGELATLLERVAKLGATDADYLQTLPVAEFPKNGPLIERPTKRMRL